MSHQSFHLNCQNCYWVFRLSSHWIRRRNCHLTLLDFPLELPLLPFELLFDVPLDSPLDSPFDVPLEPFSLLAFTLTPGFFPTFLHCVAFGITLSIPRSTCARSCIFGHHCWCCLPHCCYCCLQRWYPRSIGTRCCCSSLKPNFSLSLSSRGQEIDAGVPLTRIASCWHSAHRSGWLSRRRQT